LRQHANSLCSTLLFTREDNEKLQDQAILAGARGHISHRASMDEFLHAIDRVHAGDVWLSQQASGRLLKQLFKQNTQLSGRQENELSPHPPSTADLEQQDVQYASTAQYLQQLTPREQRILCALLNAPEAPAKTIAVLLNISESTLRNHLTRIYEKLGVKNRNGLFSLSLHGGFPFLPNSSRMN
jgi:DNA-binding NarL/FixJ family response regulator